MECSVGWNEGMEGRDRHLYDSSEFKRKKLRQHLSFGRDTVGEFLKALIFYSYPIAPVIIVC